MREIRKREEESHRQDIKPDIDKLENKMNGRSSMNLSNSRSRNENDVNNDYKTRSHHDDDRRDRRRSPPKPRPIKKSRSPDLKSR